MKRLKKLKIINRILLAIILMISFSACTEETLDQGSDLAILSSEDNGSEQAKDLSENIDENKAYYKMEDVANYIHFFNKLPKNYMTKNEAKARGREPKKNNLWEVTDKAVIGGDHFGNYEKILPEASYREADVNYQGGARGPERLVYDKDGNVFYTKDHYETFERIY